MKRPENWLARRFGPFSLSTSLEEFSKAPANEDWKPNWFGIVVVISTGLAAAAFWAFTFVVN